MHDAGVLAIGRVFWVGLDESDILKGMCYIVMMMLMLKIIFSVHNQMEVEHLQPT